MVSCTDRDREAGGGHGPVPRRAALPARPVGYHPPDDTADTADPTGADVVSALPGPASCRASSRVSPRHDPGVGAVYPCHGLGGPGPRKTVEPLSKTASAGSQWPAGGRDAPASPTPPRHEARASGVSYGGHTPSDDVVTRGALTGR